MPKSKRKTKYKQEARARRELAKGYRIAAIKTIRDANGLGLAESMNVVDLWTLKKSGKYPPRGVAPAAPTKPVTLRAVLPHLIQRQGAFSGTYEPDLLPRPLYHIHKNDEGYWLRVRPLTGAEGCYHLGNPGLGRMSQIVLEAAMAQQLL